MNKRVFAFVVAGTILAPSGAYADSQEAKSAESFRVKWPTNLKILSSPTIERRSGSPGKPILSTLESSANPSVELQLSGTSRSEWKNWNKLVTETLFTRFDELANQSNSINKITKRKARYTVFYTVKTDRQITNIRVLSKLPDKDFENIVVQALESMKNDPVLKFPSESDDLYVEKNATWDYGVGAGKQISNIL